MKKLLAVLAAIWITTPAFAGWFDFHREQDETTQLVDTSSGAAECSARFRSYDPKSGTYMGYDGDRHPCPFLRVSPALKVTPIPRPAPTPPAVCEPPQVIEKRVEVPGPERTITKTVEVPGPERTVEKTVVIEHHWYEGIEGILWDIGYAAIAVAIFLLGFIAINVRRGFKASQ